MEVRRLLDRMSESVHHLAEVDRFFMLNDPDYRVEEESIRVIPGFNDLMADLYFGQDGRQMILGDVVEYMITGRLLYTGYSKPESYVKILFHMANQVLIQENVIRNPSLRKKFMDSMEAKGKRNFFKGPDSDWKSKYSLAKAAPNSDVDGARKPLYRVVDSLLPKSLGTASELLVFAYLVNSQWGYVLPLLTYQRVRGPQGDVIAPPDFVLIRRGRLFGFEVGAGPGGIGKVGQSNTFMASTGAPVITLLVNSPINNASYRCPACGKWILYCKTTIEEYSKQKIDLVNSDLQELDSKCASFPDCPSAVYYGDLGDGGLHYHYTCVKSQPKVVRALASGRIHHMILTVEGADQFHKASAEV